jgi:hypothetical protein
MFPAQQRFKSGQVLTGIHLRLKIELQLLLSDGGGEFAFYQVSFRVITAKGQGGQQQRDHGNNTVNDVETGFRRQRKMKRSLLRQAGQG